MKGYIKNVAVVSGAYAAVVAVFLLISFIVTSGGIGWEFFSAVVIAVLSLPLYISSLAILRLIDSYQSLKTEKSSAGDIFERILNVSSLLFVTVSVLSLICISIAMAVHIKSNAIRHGISNVAPIALLFSCIGNVSIVFDNFLRRVIARILQKRNPSASVDGKGILILRILLIVAENSFLPAAFAIARILKILI